MPEFKWRGKNTWRQISTNVSPETLKVLRQVISKNKSSMSQLLRELIEESPVVKYETVPQPIWASQLSENITALRTEIADLRAEVAAIQRPKREPDGETLASELTSEIAQLRQEMIFVHAGTKAKLEEFEEQTSQTTSQPEVKKNGWPLLGRFSQLFQPKHLPVAATNQEQKTDSEAPVLLEVS